MHSHSGIRSLKKHSSCQIILGYGFSHTVLSCPQCPFRWDIPLAAEKCWNGRDGRAGQEFPSCQDWGNCGTRSHVISAPASHLWGNKNRPRAPLLSHSLKIRRAPEPNKMNSWRTEYLRTQMSFSSSNFSTFGRTTLYGPLLKITWRNWYKNKQNDSRTPLQTYLESLGVIQEIYVFSKLANKFSCLLKSLRHS